MIMLEYFTLENDNGMIYDAPHILKKINLLENAFIQQLLILEVSSFSGLCNHIP